MKAKMFFLFFIIIFTIGCAAQRPNTDQSNKNTYTWVDNRPGFAERCLEQELKKTSIETYEDCMARDAAVIVFSNVRQEAFMEGAVRIIFQSEEIRETCHQLKVVGMYQSGLFTKPATDGGFAKAEFADVFYEFPEALWYINVSDKRSEILLIPEYTHPYQHFKISCD